MNFRVRVLPQLSIARAARAARVHQSAVGLALLVSLALAGACSSEPEPFTPASLRVIGPPDLVGGECPSATEATYGPLTFNNGTPTTVRLTYLQPGPSSEDADARLLCDMVVDYGAPPPYIRTATA